MRQSRYSGTVEITGTIQSPDGSQNRITATGEGYSAAHAALLQRIPEGHQLIVIRTS
jgi:hypothetical protein